MQKENDLSSDTRKDVIIPLKDKIDTAKYQGTVLDLLNKKILV